MGLSKDELRCLGYKEGADGQWRKEDPASAGGASKPKPERHAKRQLADPAQLEGSELPRYIAIITRYTCQRVDPDNLGAKWYIDALRHLGVIQDDTARDIEAAFTTEKVATKEEERTEIELWEI